MRLEPLTYGQLEFLLTELGYRLLHASGEPRVFRNSDFDAVSVLPLAPPDEIARPHHLINLRKVSVEKGIVDEPTFDALLVKAHCYDKELAPG
jgi:hypothetical protein